MVVGGGIVGASIAYHLTRRDLTDVVIIEQGQVTSGTTWHAAGLVSQLKASRSLTELATYSARLFEELEDETGQATGYRTPGSISVAADPERWEEILRGASMGAAIGVESRVLEPDELAERWPLINPDGLVGALYLPGDGQTSPVDTTRALVQGARQRGATLVEGVAVTGVTTTGNQATGRRVTGVQTEQGPVEAEIVILAAGMWTRHLAATVGVDVPLQACEHFYLVTEPIEGLDRNTPTLRDPGNYTYIKEETGKLMVGFFEPRGKVWNLDGVPRHFAFGTLDEDWDHVGPVFERAIQRVPMLAECGIQLLFNGPEAFTPDGVYHLGPAPDLDGCWVAAGFNSVGIQSAGGAGWALAEWIADQHPPTDLTAVDPRRALPFQAEPEYLAQRIPESLGLLYAMHWPHRQYQSARDQRRSPLHQRLADAGAVFGETAGWERPNWYARPGQDPVYHYSYGRQNWWSNSGEECRATRQRVALFDQSSFAQFSVAGPDARAALDLLSVADIDVAPMTTVYTQWCNHRGGIEADLTVTRLDDDRFLVVTSAGSQGRDLARLRWAARQRRVTIDDQSGQRAVLGIMGPQARHLLAPITDSDLSNEAFPFGSARWLTVAGCRVLALRLSYVGELGWELYADAGDAVAVHDAVVEAGLPLGLARAGFHAMDSLRLEAGYRHWGHDLTDQDSPLEAGLGFTVAWDKAADFVGRAALETQRDQPRSRRLIQFRVDDPDELIHHDEPLWRAGRVVGQVTSGAWSYTQDRCLGMGYLSHPEGEAVSADWLAQEPLEVEIAGRRVPVTPSLRAFYDPGRHQVRV